MSQFKDTAVHHQSMLLSEAESPQMKETMADSKNEFDDLLTTIGFGRWQTPIILATVLIALQMPINMIGSSFLSAPMAFRCSPSPPANIIEILSYNLSQNSLNTDYYDSTCLSTPITTAVEVAVNNDSSNKSGTFTGLPSCPYIEYDTSNFKSTIFSEWHLVCERSSLRPLFQMMYSIGGLIGSIISGHIGDRFGRKKAILIGCVGILLAVAMMLIKSYPVVLAMRIAVGIMNSIALLPAWSLALESTPSRHRSLVGMLLGLPYTLGVIWMALYGFLIRTWQYQLLVGTAPALLLLPLALCIDESPSWLIQKGRAEEATRILEKAVKQNKAEISTPVVTTVNKLVEISTLSSQGNPDEKGGSKSFVAKLRDLLRYLRSPAMRNILILTSILWFLQSCLYLSITINANNFSSSGPFLYVALTGTMDTAAILISTPLATRIGRKVVIFTGMFAGAILFLAALLVPTEYYWGEWLLVMTGFLLLAGTFQLNFIYGSELFPTDIRSRGFAFVNLMGNLGFICAPLVTEILAKYTWWAANVFFGCAGILGSLTVPFLPETRNKPLPETLQDVEDRRNKSKRRKCVAKEVVGSQGEAE